MNTVQKEHHKQQNLAMGLLIDDIVRFACKEFAKNQGSVACKKNNQDCNNVRAWECVKAVHDERTKKQEYDCAIMPDYYIPVFLYEYASEIEYALNTAYPEGLPIPLNVVSIGSGASPDLYAMYNMLQHSKDAEEISYTAIEPNPHWKKYINFIQTQHPNYYYAAESILNLSPGTKDRIKNCNLLIIQYFFSAVNCDTNGLDPYFDALIREIIPFMQAGSKIIINDVNSYYMGRDKWDNFLQKIKTIRTTATAKKLCFNKVSEKMYEYGDLYPSSEDAKETGILYVPIQEAMPFNPHLTCRSCQMIITL